MYYRLLTASVGYKCRYRLVILSSVLSFMKWKVKVANVNVQFLYPTFTFEQVFEPFVYITACIAWISN